MNLQRLFAVMEKEFALTLCSVSAWSMIIVPTAAITALVVYLLNGIARMFENGLPAWVLDYLIMLFVAMPAPNAAKIAAAGIVGDKSSRSLEPLLATPLTPLEFICSKLCIAVLPPVVFAALAFAVFVRAATSAKITGAALLGNLASPFSLGMMLALTLLLANLVALAGFLIASRKTETRSATLASTTVAEGILLLPIAAVYCGQRYHVAGRIWTAWAVTALLAANVLLFVWTLALFRRETILFKWK